MRTLLFFFILLCVAGGPNAQINPPSACATDEFWAATCAADPALGAKAEALEVAYQQAVRLRPKSGNGEICVLPVVVHIIHDGGPENISDAQVQQGLDYLNAAFRNTGYYDPTTGVDVEIEFCLAQRDPEGNATSGIVRYRSPVTDLSNHTHEQLVSLASWPSQDYINIRLVRTVCAFGRCDLGGYAFLPSLHGWIGDGIVAKAILFGASPAHTSTAVHEMGHYLGLLHTFTGGCPNDDCLTQGDRVCDTPPDQQTGTFLCEQIINSCQTDADDSTPQNPFRSMALGGLGDQPDMHHNYLDYNGFSFCRDRFTAGQKARMHYFLHNARASLLASHACYPPCARPVSAYFTTPTQVIDAGELLVFNNASSQAASYRWFVNDSLVATSRDLSFQFLREEIYTVRLEAVSDSPECGPDSYTQEIYVACPVEADFSYTLETDRLNFTDQSTANTTRIWELRDDNGVLLYTSSQASDEFPVGGHNYLQLCLEARNTYCSAITCRYLNLTDGQEICDNDRDDDGDGLVDLFDPDCPCVDATYQATCPVDCEYVPDSFPQIELTLEWESEVIFPNIQSYMIPLVGDVNNDGQTEIITTSALSDANQTLTLISGTNGNIAEQINLPVTVPTAGVSFKWAVGRTSINNQISFFAIQNNNLYALNYQGNQLWSQNMINDLYRLKPNIADFNGDGIAELYVGTHIVNSSSGEILINGEEGGGCMFINQWTPCFQQHTLAADLITDSPGLELAAGNTVYQININNPSGTAGNTITPIIAEAPIADGLTSVGDIDGDGELDVVTVTSNTHPGGGGIWVWNPRTGQLIASADAGENGGIPFIGDVTGDCLPEIGMTFKEELRMYQYDGSRSLQLLYSIPTTDESGFTGLSMFDFNQDGRQELIYRDETYLLIIEGATGRILTGYPVRSSTAFEYPVIADVDQDGEAEILVAGYPSEADPNTRIYCFGSGGAPWAPARRVWNQYGYHVTNVNDDLSIPRQPQSVATPLPGYEDCSQPTCPTPYNAFLAQATYRTQAGCVQWPAEDDLGISTRMRCLGDSVEVCVSLSRMGTIENSGGIPMWCGVQPDHIWFQNCCERPQLTFVIEDSICFMLPRDLLEAGQMFVSINDPDYPHPDRRTPTWAECDYSNNTDTLGLDISAPDLDLGPDIYKCASEVITLNAGSGFASYQWSDYTTDSLYSSSFAGSHSVTVTDQCGREQRDTVYYHIDPAQDVDLGPDQTLCAGDTLAINLPAAYDFIAWESDGNISCTSCPQLQAWSDTAFTISVVAGQGNCLSADTLHLSYRPAVEINEARSICAGDTLIYRNRTLSSAGIYTFPLNSCDSVVVLELTVLPTMRDTVDYTLCPGDSIQVGTQWLSAPGSYEVRLPATQGCDTLRQVTISEAPTITQRDTLQLCTGDSLQIFGQWVYTAGEWSETYGRAEACDSTQVYRVELLPLLRDMMSYTLCPGDSVQVGGQWLSLPGSYEVRLPATQGCDTLRQVTISEASTITQRDTLQLCTGDSLQVFGEWVSEAGEWSQTYGRVEACDSTQVYTVELSPLLRDTVAYTLCPGDSVQVGGQWLSLPGSYEVRLPATEGCDTLRHVTITHAPTITRRDTLQLCTGDSLQIFGQWVYAAGEWSETYGRAEACDSTQVYTVELLPLLRDTVRYTLCPGDSMQVSDQWLSLPGSYEVRLPATEGCDTLRHVTITHAPTITRRDTLQLCTGDSLQIFGEWVSQAGEWSQTYSRAEACDSTQVYTVELSPLLRDTVRYTLCPGDSVQVSDQWLSLPGSYEVRLPATQGCDTLRQVNITHAPTIIQRDTLLLCAGDSIQLFGQWVSADSEWSQTYTRPHACDSTQVYQVFVAPPVWRYDTLAICAGDSTWLHDRWLREAGVYTDTIWESACQVVQATRLEVLPTAFGQSSLELCPGDSVLLGQTLVTGPAEVEQVYTATNGCDSVHYWRVTQLAVPPAPNAAVDCATQEVIVQIAADHPWEILWDNGDTTQSSRYPGGSQAVVNLSSNEPPCTETFSLALPVLPDTSVLMPPGDTAIHHNQSLSLNLNLDPAQWQVRWFPAAAFSCDTCMQTQLRPQASTTIELWYIHSSSCMYQHSFRVDLRLQAAIYVPNAFSPNGDGVNDYWQVYPNEAVQRIDEVRLFDRWGEPLAHWTNTSAIRWDGTFRGQPLDQQVVVYYLRYTDMQGSSREMKGEVVIVR